MKCDVTAALQVLPLFCVSQDRQLHIHRHGCSAHLIWPFTQLQLLQDGFLSHRISYREIFSNIFIHFCKSLSCFETRNFGGTCCDASWKTWAASSPWTFVLSHLNKLRHISEHPKLSVFPICMFFVFFHFSPSDIGILFYFVLNRNLICYFCYRCMFLCIKVEEFNNNYMYVSAWLPWDGAFGHKKSN